VSKIPLLSCLRPARIEHPFRLVPFEIEFLLSRIERQNMPEVVLETEVAGLRVACKALVRVILRTE